MKIRRKKEKEHFSLIKVIIIYYILSRRLYTYCNGVLRIIDNATTLSITTFSIMTLSITTFSIMTLSITTFSIKTTSITTFSITLK